MKRAFGSILGVLIVIFVVYSTNMIGHIAQLFYSDGSQGIIRLDYKGEELFSPERIEKIVQTDTQMRFSAITPFDWDRLYVVQPYASDLELIRLFGFLPKMLGTTHIYLKDDRNLLVFLKEDEIVIHGEVLMKYVQFQRYDTEKKKWFDYYLPNICMQKRKEILFVENCNH